MGVRENPAAIAVNQEARSPSRHAGVLVESDRRLRRNPDRISGSLGKNFLSGLGCQGGTGRQEREGPDREAKRRHFYFRAHAA